MVERELAAAVFDLDETLLVGLRMPETWKAALAPLAAEIHVSRCSAVDASAPAIEAARASVSLGRADRRRAIGFMLSQEVGASVRFGEREWREKIQKGCR